ncbi:RNA-binding motif, single-stranded-interacting protein 1 [Drosophila takahashii]|uniref:RNA-binding motif, single-stranded-interacting protein 1 n=1 Tax=Drosophila takahashii TaxID=29030 RepID=UPI001CF836CC|nr:RNA-binding motif, single-stranded-interacting protein 1 [Drosophila takahashii]
MSETVMAGILLANGPTRLKSRILVRNLPPNCSRVELAKVCECFGKILGSRIDGTEGFVQFASESEAENAIEALDKSYFKSHLLDVSNASYRSQKERTQDLPLALSLKSANARHL